MKNSKCIFYLLPLIACISSCGYDLKEVYRQDAYNSPVFEENYYTNYDSKINPDNENNAIRDVFLQEIDDSFSVSTTYEEAKANGIDEDMSKDIEYTASDGTTKVYHGLDYIYDFDEKKDYGPNKRMNKVDSIFSYGYLSKLYDGQMFCNGYYQLARVQINERGFGVLYEKEMTSCDYIGISFKASVDYTNPEIHVPSHTCKFRFYISFYKRDGSKFDVVKTYFDFENVLTNHGEPANREHYLFYAFKLDQLNLERIAGYSLSYDLIEDEYTTNYGLQHSLMIYEVLLPNSTWR